MTDIPMRPSNEASARQLQVARLQGNAFAVALHAMERESGMQCKDVDDYTVGVTVEEAEGMWRRADENTLVWSEPKQGLENAHVEVVVADRADGRFIPDLDVSVEVLDGERSLGRKRLPFLWHPFVYHYGHNWSVPHAGKYTVAVHIGAPTFYRHDPINGLRYARPVDVVFERVQIRPGLKRSKSPRARTAPSGPVR
jgi:hypothetical protein